METEDAVKGLSSLAQETRIEIFRLLVEDCPGGVAAGEIASRLGIPNPTLSFHLNHLVQSGIVTRHRESRCIIYALHVDRVHDLFSYLMDDCCEGRPELCSPLLSGAGVACNPQGTAEG